MYYLLSLGANLDPVRNLSLCATALVEQFGPVLFFPFVHTEPEGMQTRNAFINGAAVLRTDCSATGLKQWAIDLELRLGRDRSDPARSRKDRPCDLDLHDQGQQRPCWHALALQEGYLEAVLRGPWESARLARVPVGPVTGWDRPTWIGRDGAGRWHVAALTPEQCERWHRESVLPERAPFPH